MGLEAVNFLEQDRFQKQFRYHHGNLRATLVEAALEILKTEGIEELSLRSIARKSNVSQAAPYSHFRNKKDLIAAVAESGFQKLALQMAEDASGSKSVYQQVEKLMLSYINFAQENKPLFQVMFCNELSDMTDCPTLAMTASKSYSLISTAISQRESTEGNTNILAATIWSMCHGIANLVIGGKINVEEFNSSSTEDFVKKTLTVFESSLS